MIKEYSLEDVTVRPTVYDDINDIFEQERLDTISLDTAAHLLAQTQAELETLVNKVISPTRVAELQTYFKEQLTATKAQKLLDGDKSCNKR